uniref:Uncharacterized protein n=1 Tax=Cucumis sativus TaxID=3659 RepID=A0A0A0KD73_CUCSA
MVIFEEGRDLKDQSRGASEEGPRAGGGSSASQERDVQTSSLRNCCRFQLRPPNPPSPPSPSTFSIHITSTF